MEYRTLEKPHIRKASPKRDSKLFGSRAARAWPWIVAIEVDENGNDRGMAFATFDQAAAFARKTTHDRTLITRNALFAVRSSRKYRAPVS